MRQLRDEDVLGRPRLEPDHHLTYGPRPEQFAELRIPVGRGPWPVAVLVHGGCWRDIADLGYMEALASVLTDGGWATWNVEFRRLGDPGGGFPGTLRDVASALDHLRAIAGEHLLDLDRVVTIGHSSGGHLALWLAARHRIPDGTPLHAPAPVRPRGAVSLAGIGDLPAFHRLERRACDDQVARLLGGEPADLPDRVAATSPASLLPLGVPQLLVSGEDDEDVPVEHVRGYAEAARRAGDDVRLHVVPDAGHFEVVAPWSDRWSEVGPVVGGFLEGLG